MASKKSKWKSFLSGDDKEDSFSCRDDDEDYLPDLENEETKDEEDD